MVHIVWFWRGDFLFQPSINCIGNAVIGQGKKTYDSLISVCCQGFCSETWSIFTELFITLFSSVDSRPVVGYLRMSELCWLRRDCISALDSSKFKLTFRFSNKAVSDAILSHPGHFVNARVSKVIWQVLLAQPTTPANVKVVPTSSQRSEKRVN